MSLSRLYSLATGTNLQFPSWYPNRAVRRAVKQRREFRLPNEWKAFLALNPNLRQTIVTI